jgi:hypothetical protein
MPTKRSTQEIPVMVMLGHANSRMKDFYDIWILSWTFPFARGPAGARHCCDICAPANEIPVEAPDALTPEFGGDPGKQRQWVAFAADLEGAPRELQTVLSDLAAFLMPDAAAARGLS